MDENEADESGETEPKKPLNHHNKLKNAKTLVELRAMAGLSDWSVRLSLPAALKKRMR